MPAIPLIDFPEGTWGILNSAVVAESSEIAPLPVSRIKFNGCGNFIKFRLNQNDTAA